MMMSVTDLMFLHQTHALVFLVMHLIFIDFLDVQCLLWLSYGDRLTYILHIHS